MASNSRWLSTTKHRIGKLFFHGCNEVETKKAAEVLKKLSTNWRSYVAGSEGYLIGPERRGLFRRGVTWGDEDVMVSHVNNVKYIKWAEAGRVNMCRKIGANVDPTHRSQWENMLNPSSDLGLILKSIKCDFKFPIEFPDSITVYHKLHSISTHSFTLDAVVISEKHQRVAAKLHEDLVTYQYAGGEKPGKVHVPGWMREVFEETLKLQEMEKRRVQEEMQGIEGIVRELEGRVMGRKELHS